MKFPIRTQRSTIFFIGAVIVYIFVIMACIVVNASVSKIDLAFIDLICYLSILAGIKYIKNPFQAWFNGYVYFRYKHNDRLTVDSVNYGFVGVEKYKNLPKEGILGCSYFVRDTKRLYIWTGEKSGYKEVANPPLNLGQ